MTSSTPYTAEDLRNQGNFMYKSVDSLTEPNDIMTNLKMSIYYYSMSRTLSTSEAETASAFKNLAKANMKLAIATPETVDKWKCFKDSLGHFDEAFTRGKRCKDQAWLDDIITDSHVCASKMFEFLEDIKANAFELAEEFVYMIVSNDIKATCFFKIALMHYRFGIAAIELCDYTEGLNQMKECYFPLSEAARVGREIPDVQKHVDELQKEINKQIRLAKALDSRDKGDSLFGTIMDNLEATEKIWEVVDKYRYSIWMFQETDIKQEAITYSRLGQVYDLVLKIPYEAKEWFKKAIALAQHIRPMDFNNEGWYQLCTEALAMYQNNSVLLEEEEGKKRNESVLNELADELSQLKVRENEPYNTFLPWLYSTFPPTNPANKLDLVQKDKEDDFQVKFRCLRNAVCHYHPDRVDETVCGLKVKVLHQEITKQLTNRYEQAKDVKKQ